MTGSGAISWRWLYLWPLEEVLDKSVPPGAGCWLLD